MKSWVWTENEKEDMLAHIKMGVDGIITDYPERGLEARK
jgi:glycerophosphoryl diester phosphodiesterase